MPSQSEVNGPPEIVATFGGRRVLRNQVLGWEARRAKKVSSTLGLRAAAAEPSEQLAAITQRKLELGHDRIEALLGAQLRLSAAGVGVLARLSSGRRVVSSVGLAVNTGSATGFVQWWNDHVVTGDEAALLAICPDHWLIRPALNGWQEVVETTGGSPMASRLFIDYQDTGALRSPPDPRYPHQLTAVARLRDGTPIGGLRHQLRDTVAGFEMTLAAEFPVVMLPNLVAGHRWHLACEFSNMIERAVTSPRSEKPATP